MKEKKFFGRNSCSALFASRPEEIIRLYLAKDLLGVFAPLVRYCVEKKLAYHVVEEEELAKVSGSQHHEGVCILARVAAAPVFSAVLKELEQGDHCLLYLEGVENPHNIGAIMRAMAFFGVRYLLATSALPQSGSAARVSEGGSEYVTVLNISPELEELKKLRSIGYTIIGTSPAGSAALRSKPLEKKCVILLGSEQRGLSEETMAFADRVVALQGSGKVESLSVVTACAVFLAEYQRLHHTPVR